MFSFGFGLGTLGLALIGLPTTVAMFLAATVAGCLARAVSARSTVTSTFALVAVGFLGRHCRMASWGSTSPRVS
ncbi:hypothetical protein ACFWP5_23860 [Streptomyces sp. NPDC058469]|uniref:hypothetical protein n=1 Tax=Streptomyces sp. NPDC058469 TaxID=3346514 RepID=UPI0036523AEA